MATAVHALGVALTCHSSEIGVDMDMHQYAVEEAIRRASPSPTPSTRTGPAATW